MRQDSACLFFQEGATESSARQITGVLFTGEISLWEVPGIIVLFLTNRPVAHDYFLPFELTARQPGTDLGSTLKKAQGARFVLLVSYFFLTFIFHWP